MGHADRPAVFEHGFHDVLRQQHLSLKFVPVDRNSRLLRLRILPVQARRGYDKPKCGTHFVFEEQSNFRSHMDECSRHRSPAVDIRPETPTPIPAPAQH
jgi:hypothetical protein